MKTIYCVVGQRDEDEPNIIQCWQYLHEAEDHVARLRKRHQDTRLLWDQHWSIIDGRPIRDRVRYWDNLISKPEYSHLMDYDECYWYWKYDIVPVTYHG